jgi:hypothetical protein
MSKFVLTYVKNLMIYLNREILKQHRCNQNRHISKRMVTFCENVAKEVEADPGKEIDGLDRETATVLAYATAHGYRFHYDSKYRLGVARAINRPELNGQDSSIADPGDEEDEEDEHNAQGDN